jgi:hypothetical protein
MCVRPSVLSPLCVPLPQPQVLVPEFYSDVEEVSEEELALFDEVRTQI